MPATRRSTAQRPLLVVKVAIDGRERRLDLLNLKRREKIEFEEYMQMPLHRIATEEWLFSEKATAFYVYLIRRREDASFTLEDALVADYEIQRIGREEDEAGGERPTKSRRTNGSRS